LIQTATVLRAPPMRPSARHTTMKSETLRWVGRRSWVRCERRRQSAAPVQAWREQPRHRMRICTGARIGASRRLAAICTRARAGSVRQPRRVTATKAVPAAGQKQSTLVSGSLASRPMRQATKWPMANRRCSRKSARPCVRLGGMRCMVIRWQRVCLISLEYGGAGLS